MRYLLYIFMLSCIIEDKIGRFRLEILRNIQGHVLVLVWGSLKIYILRWEMSWIICSKNICRKCWVKMRLTTISFMVLSCKNSRNWNILNKPWRNAEINWFLIQNITVKGSWHGLGTKCLWIHIKTGHIFLL